MRFHCAGLISRRLVMSRRAARTCYPRQIYISKPAAREPSKCTSKLTLHRPSIELLSVSFSLFLVQFAFSPSPCESWNYCRPRLPTYFYQRRARLTCNLLHLFSSFRRTFAPPPPFVTPFSDCKRCDLTKFDCHSVQLNQPWAFYSSKFSIIQWFAGVQYLTVLFSIRNKSCSRLTLSPWQRLAT